MTRGSGGAAETRRFVNAPDGRVMGEYGTSAADVMAEFIWFAPEAANDNDPTNDGIAGYAPLAVATPNLSGAIQLNWVHGNHLGVPLVFTDAAGQVTTNTTNDYLAPGFPGQSRTLGDLYYNRYRDYDPSTGRYIQADPIGLAGGANPFLYAGGNPVSGMDPWGLEKINAFPMQQTGFRDAADRTYQSLPRDVREGFYHIFGHGNNEGFCPYSVGKCLSPQEFLKWMTDNHYTKGKPIMIWACSTGAGEASFAEQVSALLGGRIIVAPSANTMWMTGTLQSHRYVGIRNGGTWRRFGGRP